MSEFEELQRRVESLEGEVRHVVDEHAYTRRVALHADRDVADLQEQRRADKNVLQALRETQLEQGRILEAGTATLQEHSKLLAGLVVGQVQQGATLERHGSVLERHSSVLERHSSALDAIMDHMGITPPETTVPEQTVAED